MMEGSPNQNSVHLENGDTAPQLLQEAKDALEELRADAAALEDLESRETYGGAVTSFEKEIEKFEEHINQPAPSTRERRIENLSMRIKFLVEEIKEKGEAKE